MSDVERTPDMSVAEMEEILKAIIRDGSNAAARIAAIKELRSLKRGERPVDEAVLGLYEAGNPARIRTKAA